MATLRCSKCDTPLNEDGICPECDTKEDLMTDKQVEMLLNVIKECHKRELDSVFTALRCMSITCPYWRDKTTYKVEMIFSEWKAFEQTYLFETWNKIEYIADARPITDDILKQAITKLGEKITDAQTEERNRSTSLSYAKDLCVGGIIKLDEVFIQAEKHYRFIKGQKQED